MIKAIYAKSYALLTLKMMGYFHDHCYHLYAGKISEVPENLKEWVDLKTDKKYIFLYQEDIPNLAL
jgi:hypothetical protein